MGSGRYNIFKMTYKKISKSKEIEQKRYPLASIFIIALVIIIIAIVFLSVLFRYLKIEIDEGIFIYVVGGFIILDLIILIHKAITHGKPKKEHVREIKKRVKLDIAPQKPIVKAEIKKIVKKEVREKKEIPKKHADIVKKSVVVYFALFLLAIVMFYAAYFYNHTIFMGVSLVMLLFSIIGYRKVKYKGVRKKPPKVRIISAKLPVKKPEKKPMKVEEKKIVKKEVKKEKRAPKKKVKKGNILFIALFLIGIVLFIIAYFYRNMLIMGATLVLIFGALLSYNITKKRKKVMVELKQAGEAAKENKVILSKLSEKAKEKEKKAVKEKIPVVTELPKGLKIELSGHETDLDVLYKIVEQKGRVKLSALAKYFGVDKKKVEEWATILEEHELIRVYYPAVGELEIRKWEIK